MTVKPYTIKGFQSTLPRRERRQPLSNLQFLITISIHAPAKGATRKICTHNADYWISIHAPAKGATNCYLSYTPPINISIHAPAKGATWENVNGGTSWIFQSTLPRRERRTDLGFFSACLGISIHAPAKGATSKRRRKLGI